MEKGEGERSPWLDIKNVSCGNLTTGKGRRRCGAGDVARKAQEGCVKKQGQNEREKRKDREGGFTVAAYENFYDFYALAPAHLEIRFNSLNFKKLPPLSLAPSFVDRAVPDPFSPVPIFPSAACLFFRPTSHVSSSSPENEIAPLYTVGG